MKKYSSNKEGKVPTLDIVQDKNILGGKPVVRGTRISVDLIMSYFANGYGAKQVKRDYPFLTDNQIDAAKAFMSEAMNRA